MPLSEIVKSLRTAQGWGAPRLAKEVQAAGAKKVRAAHIQNVERGASPAYIRELAQAFGKSVDDLYNWRPGMPTAGPNAPEAGVSTGKLTPELLVNRYEHDIDQLRNTIWNFVDAISARLPGVASELVERLTTTADAYPDPEYGDKGFHGRLVSSLRNIARNEGASDNFSPQRAGRAPSGQKRKP